MSNDNHKANLQGVYNTLKNEGYTPPDFDTFEKDMADEANLRSVYDNLKNEGYTPPDFDTFKSDMGYVSTSTVQVPTFTEDQLAALESDTTDDTPTTPITPIAGTFQRFNDSKRKVTGSNKPLSEADKREMQQWAAQTQRRTQQTVDNFNEYVKPEAVEGFWGGVAEGSKALYQGLKNFVGESAKMVATGSQGDYERAAKHLEGMRAAGYDLSDYDHEKAIKDYEWKEYETKKAAWEKEIAKRKAERSQMGFIDAIIHKINDPKRPLSPANHTAAAFNETSVAGKATQGRAFYAIGEALKENNGDVDKAAKWLSEKAQKETWGDETSREARIGLSKIRPTKGTAAWIGNLIPQMVGNVGALAASVNPYTRWLAAPLGVGNMGVLTASTAGSSMAEAREYGASEGDVWRAAGIDAAIELGTEAIPFGRYFGRITKRVSNKVVGDVADAVLTNPKADAEIARLLGRARKELPGGKLLTKDNLMKYLGDITAEGASEFAAEALQTISPMIYQNPEDYPTLMEILENGWEGAKGGAFMGTFLGGGSLAINNRQQKQRRRAQGNVILAETKDGDVVEVLGQTDNMMTVLNKDGKQSQIDRRALINVASVTSEEFEKGVVEKKADDAYDAGYMLEEPQEMNNAKTLYEMRRQALIDNTFTEAGIEWIDNNPEEALESVAVEVRPLVTDYINAKQVYDGMMQRSLDDIDDKVTESDAAVDMRTNKADGMVHGATMKVNDRQVYIVDGNVATLEDGTIDATNSAESVIVIDAATGEKEFVSPKDILSVATPVAAEEEKAVAREEIVAVEQQITDNKINGVLPFIPGDIYTGLGPTGEAEQYTIIGDAMNEQGLPIEGEITVALADGTQMNMPKEMIQQRVTEANKARVVAFEEERAAEMTESDLGSTENVKSVESAGNVAETETIQPNEATLQQTALSRIPTDEQGNPLLDRTDPETAWDGAVEYLEDEADAKEYVDSMVSKLTKEAEKAKKAVSNVKPGGDMAQFKAAKATAKQVQADAEARLSHWQAIAGVQAARKQAADIAAQQEAARVAEEERLQREAARQQAEAERIAAEEAARQEREALNGVPDVLDDTPQDARARGFRRVNGYQVVRQEPVPTLQGKEVGVKFSDKDIPVGHVAVMEASQLQPSHVMGQRNPNFFIDEAQPKDRRDEASVLSSEKIATNVRPEELTSSATAYTGAPTVNNRGEVIQGNNRSAALRLMYSNTPTTQESAARYKQHLIDHAEEFGLNADEIAAMNAPVMVNMLDVADEEAIRLGQFVAQDTESGGVERIKPKNAVQKMGKDMKSFANVLLRSTDDETSFSQLIDNNGAEVLKWMSQKGHITPTQYQSAFDSKGAITAETKNDLKGIMYQSIFRDGSSQLEEMFNAMPVKAQRAILATAFRDYDSTAAESMIPEIQNSIRAYYALSQDADFVNSKDWKSTRTAVEGWKRQYVMDDVTGESYLPAEKFSNFALYLATMYKGQTQSYIQETFNRLFDLIQGTQEATLFEEADNTPRTLAEAIKELLNIDYNGQNGSNAMADNATASQGGQQGSTGDTAAGERTEDGERPADSGGGTESDSGESVTIQPIGKGVFGNIYDQFKGKAKAAIDFLKHIKSGEAIGALHHRDIGEISIAWGNSKAGLQKISTKHPEVLDNLQDIIDDMHIVSSSDNRIRLESDTHFAVISRDWLGENHSPWLLTAYEKKESSVNNNTMDTAETHLGRRNDTATPQDTAFSADKDTEVSDTKQEKAEEFTITPFQYTTKRGKVLDMHLVKFGRELTKEEQRNAKALAKELKGWYDSKQGGFMMRSAEDAQQIVDAIMDESGETLSDAAPVSLSDVRKVNAESLMGALSEQGEATLSEHSEPVAEEQPKNEGALGLVSDARMEELKARLRKKLGGQLNMGIDPEILAIGMELAAGHIDRGVKSFADFAKRMVEDLGDMIRPYLKAFYNGARDMPEIVENGLAAEMTPYDEVSNFDVANFDKRTVNAIATAEMVVSEQEKVLQAEEAKREIVKKRNENRKVNKNKSVSSQTEQRDLFGSPLEETTKEEENGLQGVYNIRTERLSADNHRQSERGSEASDNEEVREDSRRTDGIGTGGSRTVSEEVQRGNKRPIGRLQGLEADIAPSERKNTHNNHSERGANHAPTSVDARIDANIKAIELAQQLIQSGEQATEQQMNVLRKFSGWGGLGAVFNEESAFHSGHPRNAKLRELLGEEAYREAVMSANSAYYTPAYVVDTLWDIATQMGFKGGNILEGSAGIGNILGQMPTSISERSDIHAVEIDRTSGGILSLLYPDAKVEIQGFEETRIPNGSVDLAITNVPFVTGLRVNDTTGDKDLSKKFHNIHDFCIAKNVRKLREGGIGLFITSNGTLDNSKKLRDWIVNEGGADFIGAFRMHNKTFGGTGVTSDIIVIRKRVNGRKSANAIDVSTITGERSAEFDTGEKRKVKGEEVAVIKHLAMDYNRYFIEHPENMAGVMQFAFEQGETFRPTSKGLYPVKSKNQEQMLTEFVGSFKEETEDAVILEESSKTGREYVMDASADGKKLGELYVKDGKLVIAGAGGYYPLSVNANKVKGHTKVECFNAYAAIKEALTEVLAYQTENESNEGLKPLLAKLNKAYDSFVATYGHFNKNTAISFLRNDVDYPNVFSLERYEETGDKSGNRVQKFGKADVFSQRVVEKEKEPTPTNVKDGIIASVFKFGRIDASYIAEQLGKSVDEVKSEIIESGYGFEDPATRQMELSYQYLSGNVREKLRQAQENNEDGAYDRNIKALQEVVPMDIPAHLIDFTLGSSWITPKLYEEYVLERTDIEVKFTAAGGTWYMDAPYYVNKEKNRSMGVYSEMFKTNIFGHTLIEAAISNKTVTVSRTNKKWDGSTETITDREATQACSAKIDEIRQDFKDWARQKMQSDAEMSADMERLYNDTFNNYVPMSIPDDFVPEYFGGASHKFKMRPHQGRAIVRGTMQPLLLAHEVGTGKTFTLISTAMEMRRLGTARKPMIVVQNATVGQFVASAKELYPNAKILTLEEADRTAEGRKNFYAKIRHNDWDMIVVPQSTFEFIPDSEERQMQFVQDKIEEKMAVLEKMQEADPRGESMITRQAKKEIADLEAQLADLSEQASSKRSAAAQKKREVTLQNAEVQALEMLDRRTDDVENFDDMGIDALLVDEAHEYKHLGFATAMQRGVKGVDASYSKKSQGVYLKTQAVLEKNNGRNVIFATGTPISNTAAEIWTFMRYLMTADTMKEYGIYYFDDFVRNFGNIQQMLEFTTSGKFKENNRFAGYVNLPELVRIWSGVSDIVLTKEAGGVSDKIPEMEGGKAQDLYLPQTRALRSIMKFVKAELMRYEEMSGKEKKENSHIPLTMYGIAKSAAVDARLVDAGAEDDPNSKTNEAVRQTLRSLKETAKYKGTVAIFSDNYQNKASGFNLYDDIKEKLIAEGIPADEVVVIRSGMTVKKKLDIFEKVNRGEIRVVLGSTFTLGTGVNIQERLHTVIHLDAPNRPMDYTQRNGRILRQGNLHKAMGKPVRILRFGVEDSLDVTAYQRLKTKGAIADSIMNGKQMMANSMTNRVLEEEEDVFGDTVAQLSGSEYAMLKNNAEKNVRKYESRKKGWEADQTYIHNAKPRYRGQIAEAEQRAETNRKFLQMVQDAFPDGKFTEITAGKQTFATARDMADFFKEHNKKILEKMKQMKEGGDDTHTRELTVTLGGYTFKVYTELNKESSRSGGQLFAEVHRKMTYSCPELGLEDVPVYQNLLRNAIEDIVTNVITGKDYAERVEAAERKAKHLQSELEQILSREGVPFEFEEELAQARKQYAEYSELMKKEMEEKEAKYAEMDKTVEAASDIATTEDEDDLMRDGEGAYDEDALSIANDPWAKMGMKRTKRQRKTFAGRERERMKARAKELAGMFGVDVDIVEDVSTLDGRRAKAKGFYNKKTGKVTIVLPNHSGLYDIEQTFLHEVVAHYGLRQLFGERFNTFLDNVYANAEIDVRRQIVELAKKHGWDFRTATEEYLAGLAEDFNFEKGSDPLTWWGKIKKHFMRMLHSVGFDYSGPELSDNELRYILWRSYENLKEPGRYLNLFQEAKDVAKQYELKVGNYATESTGNTGKFVAEGDAVNINERFNERLRELEADPTQKDRVLRLGRAGDVLRSAGIADAEIEMEYDRFVRKSSEDYENSHPFTASEIQDLPKAINAPIAVFNSTNGRDKVILTELKQGGNNFIVAIKAVQRNRKGGVRLVVNEITTLFPKKAKGIINWINTNEGTFYDKQKTLHWIEALQTHSETELTNEELYSAAKVVENFENPNIPAENGSEDDVLFRDGEPEESDGSASGIATNLYEKGVSNSFIHNFSEAWYDGLRAVKEAQEAVIKESGKPITDFENVYDNAIVKSSKDHADFDVMMRDYVTPLIDAVHKIVDGKRLWRGQKMTQDDLEIYLMCKHGAERNPLFAERDAKAAREERQKKYDELLAEGKVTQKEYDKQIADLDNYEKQMYEGYDYVDDNGRQRRHQGFRERDYSGLTSIFKTDEKMPVGWYEEQARKYVEEFEAVSGRELVDELWKRINKMSNFTLWTNYQSGRITGETFNNLKNMFTHYVPLRGFSEDTAEVIYDYLTVKPVPVEASAVKHAKGRSSMATRPLATLMNLGSSAIIMGNKNLVKQKLLNLALNHPTSLLTVSRQWYEKDAKGEWVPVREPEIPANATPEERHAAIEKFENEYMQLEKEGKVRRWHKDLNIGPRFEKKPHEKEHRITVMRGGHEYHVWVNGNPKLAQAINGMLNPDRDSNNPVLRSLAQVNRWRAMFLTSYSPEFTQDNFTRDITESLETVLIKEGGGYAKDFAKNAKDLISPVAVRGARKGKYSGIFYLYNRYKEGKLDLNNPRERLFHEFIANGGETGYSEVWDIDKYQKFMREVIEKGNLDMKSAVQAVGSTVELVNKGIENISRFAAYMTS